MKTIVKAVLSLCAALAVGSPAAANPQFDVVIEGLGNTLTLSETAPDTGNSLDLSLLGNDNGGFGSDWAQPAIFDGFGGPGRIVQEGRNNSIQLDVLGNANLFSVLQKGTGNVVSGQISGVGNAVAVRQTGMANVAQFRQVGRGNALAISQSSW